MLPLTSLLSAAASSILACFVLFACLLASVGILAFRDPVDPLCRAAFRLCSPWSLCVAPRCHSLSFAFSFAFFTYIFEQGCYTELMLLLGTKRRLRNATEGFVDGSRAARWQRQNGDATPQTYAVCQCILYFFVSWLVAKTPAARTLDLERFRISESDLQSRSYFDLNVGLYYHGRPCAAEDWPGTMLVIPLFVFCWRAIQHNNEGGTLSSCLPSPAVSCASRLPPAAESPEAIGRAHPLVPEIAPTMLTCRGLF